MLNSAEIRVSPDRILKQAKWSDREDENIGLIPPSQWIRIGKMTASQVGQSHLKQACFLPASLTILVIRGLHYILQFMAATASFHSAIFIPLCLATILSPRKVRTDGIRVPLKPPLSFSELSVCNCKREKAAVNETS